MEDLVAFGLAWARALPTIALVPAFGLRALPAPARGIVALALAAAFWPAAAPAARVDTAVPWIALALEQILLGLPIAVAAAVPLWAATMGMFTWRVALPLVALQMAVLAWQWRLWDELLAAQLDLEDLLTISFTLLIFFVYAITITALLRSRIAFWRCL